ncbi:MAG: polysaccharide pyruvyl transferase family protein [Planctomycetaceae bacterium]|nr:polysaccharide pyruvyl transferase family protein [Planctomycetales bacterium]MCB9923467.1 polysaccharide pyruvyl transferase family protein [Planctomycetaceae bacterium]
MHRSRQTLDRRTCLSLLGLSTLRPTLTFARTEQPKRILLRSSWQTVNIGDIAHTPGVLRILEMHLPNVEVTLWPSRIDNGVDGLLRSRFPKLKIALPGSEELKRAFSECDFLLHGSGASLVAERDVIRWREETGKPYGVYGITLPPKKSSSTTQTSPEAMARTIEVLSDANFVFFRDSKSLAFAKASGCSAPVMEFGPDGAFACDLRDDQKAKEFLHQHDLDAGKFLCCIPRLRYTPYWTIKDVPFDAAKHARNEALKEHDHAPLRQAIIEVAKQTDLKILLCPEDQTQMKVAKEMLFDPLPAETKQRVVWRPNYWLTGEAISTYVRSAGLFGNEMHSPIMCIGHGVPAIVCRWEEQTSKGFMWQDIGLGDWLFDFDKEEDVRRLPDAVVAMASDAATAKERAAMAKLFVERRQRATMQVLKEVLTS